MPKKQNEADRAAALYREQDRRDAPSWRLPHVVTLCLCALLAVALGLWLCLSPKQTFSPKEKRALQGAPSFSLEALVDGTLTKEIADFCADQFPLRSFFVRAKARTELLLGRRENNGVILGKDDYLIQRPQGTDLERQNIEQNIGYASRFATALSERGIPFFTAIVPRTIDVNTAYLPAIYDASDATVAWSYLSAAAEQNGLSLYLLKQPLLEAADAGEQVYYRTDHHWTARGAYLAYASLGELLGYTPAAWEEFELVTGTENFYGTSYAASGMYWISPDTIALPRYDSDEHMTVEIYTSGQDPLVLQGLYDMSALSSDDPYNVFLGGTNTLIRVRSTDQNDRSTLILIKDSFAQSLAPYLARHFDLLLIDPRTYKTTMGAIVDTVLAEQNAKVVLLYGIDTLSDTASLRILTFGLSE